MKIKPMWILTVVIVLAIAAGAVIVLTGGEDEDSNELGGTVGSADFNPQFLPLINQFRCSNGLKPVVTNPLLVNAAVRHNNDMINTGRFDHTGSDGSSPSARIEAAGYDWQTTAENLAQGQATVEDAFQSWVNSPGHRANMLKPDVQEIGLAYGTNANGVAFWTLNLGRTFDGIAVPNC